LDSSKQSLVRIGIPPTWIDRLMPPCHPPATSTGWALYGPVARGFGQTRYRGAQGIEKLGRANAMVSLIVAQFRETDGAVIAQHTRLLSNNDIDALVLRGRAAPPDGIGVTMHV
jgi:hypothetical protein